ncbi:MAG: adenylosuccinate lyase [Ruminococcaceae bacterium]|nr:adenylosuccinate lyase [Oscillospiraceae bacterium]
MRNTYESPLTSRYASKEMSELFSPDKKFKTWRRLWIALARAEMKLGLPVTQAQIDELEKFKDDINYEEAEKREKEVRHDVMSHVYAYGLQCPNAKGIIHLGATSCYVGDNTDLIIMRDALVLIRKRLVSVISALSAFADKYKDMPTLGFTHYQPAQLTTVGKRATLWINELLYDLSELEFRINAMQLLGSKGTTGTQASFMELFDGDEEKIKKMEQYIAEELGFDGVIPVSGQTYSRKIDSMALATLSGIAQSACKFATDLRLLSNLKEIEEPFEKKQIGSSAMPYKRNPMRSERICALSKFVISTANNPALTAATQWFERTLDDSANKRLAVAEAFLATDSLLSIYLNIASGLVVYPKVINRRVMEELPFMASENIMMDAVKRGGDRQELHELIRTHSIAAGKRVKEDGEANDLIDRIAADPAFGMSKEEIVANLDPKNYTGRSASQVTEFIRDYVKPAISAYMADIETDAELKV